MNYEAFYSDFQKLVKKHEKAGKPKNPITDPEKKQALLDRLAKGREARAAKKTTDEPKPKADPKPKARKQVVKM